MEKIIIEIELKDNSMNKSEFKHYKLVKAISDFIYHNSIISIKIYKKKE